MAQQNAVNKLSVSRDVRYWQLDKSVGLHELRAADAVALRLLCFPFSGGASQAFRGFAAALPDSWQVLAVDPPGHLWQGGAPLRRVEDMVDCYREVLYPPLKELAQECPAPLVLLGHSLGGLIAYALSARLEREQQPCAAVFINAVPPPHCPPRWMSKLSDEALIAELVRVGGISQTWLKHRARSSLTAIIPALRADLEACDYYRANDGVQVLKTPLFSIAASDDDLCNLDTMREWSRYGQEFAIHCIDGGHLFVQHSPQATAALVRGALSGRVLPLWMVR